MRERVLLLLVLPAALFASPAAAQLGPALVGRTAAANNAATVNQNPAGIMRLPELEVVLDGMLAISDNKFDVKGGTTETGGNPSNDVEIAGVPQFAFSVPAGEHFAIGFGFSVPTGFGSDYGDDWAGRYLAQESTLVFMSAQPVIAARVTDWLSLGLGVPIMYSLSDTKVAVANAPGEPDGQMKLEVDGISAGVTVSTLLEPLPGARFGVSWRSEIQPDLDGRPDFRDLGPLRQQILESLGVLGEKIDLGLRVPQSVQVGFYYEATPDLALMGDFTWIDWSRFGKIDIAVSDFSATLRTDYKDIYIGSIGAEYRFNERWKGSLGFTYVSSGVSDSDRSFALPLDEFFVSGIGATYQMNDRLEIHMNFLAAVGGDGGIDQRSRFNERVVGEFERRQSFVLQTSMVWRP